MKQIKIINQKNKKMTTKICITGAITDSYYLFMQLKNYAKSKETHTGWVLFYDSNKAAKMDLKNAAKTLKNHAEKVSNTTSKIVYEAGIAQIYNTPSI